MIPTMFKIKQLFTTICRVISLDLLNNIWKQVWIYLPFSLFLIPHL